MAYRKAEKSVDSGRLFCLSFLEHFRRRGGEYVRERGFPKIMQMTIQAVIIIFKFHYYYFLAIYRSLPLDFSGPFLLSINVREDRRSSFWLSSFIYA